MPVDPTSYDLDELRRLAGLSPEWAVERRVHQYGFRWVDRDEVRRFGVEDPTPAQREEVCRVVGVDPSVLGRKPYLRTLLGEEAEELVTRWLRHLMRSAGFEGTVITLQHYRDLGWFTTDVEGSLRDRLLAVPRQPGDGTIALDAGDHLISFAYVVRLAAAAEQARRWPWER